MGRSEGVELALRTSPASAAALYAAAFVLAVDASGAGHLLPALAETTGASARDASWFITAYMLGALLGAPLLARAASRHGRVRVLVAALVVFAGACLVVAASSSYALTVSGRFAQGFAAAPVLPLAAAHLTATVPEAHRGRSVAGLSLAYGGGFVAGIAFVSLFLLASFRLAFAFTALLALGVARAVHGVPDPSGATRDRGPGAALVAAWLASLSALAFALNRLSATALLVAVPLVALFAWLHARSEAPLLPRALFTSRPGVALAMLSGAAGLGQAAIVVLPTCAMTRLGVSAAASGPMLVPVVVGGLGANVLASARLDRWGPRPMLALGVAGLVAGDLVVVATGARVFGFELGALLVGVGASALSSGALRILATRFGAPEEANARQAAVSLLTNLGLMIGGALWGAVVQGRAPVDAVTTGMAALALATLTGVGGLALVRAARAA